MTELREDSASCQTTSFISRRLNATTFLILEDDAYGEQPHIYVKVYPTHLLINDTGCNTPRKKHLAVTSLRGFLEECPIPSNDNQVLNPGGQKGYIIICSHCHYDHILGIPPFQDTNPYIIASETGKSWILEDLPSHSLCKAINVPTPQYNIALWAKHLSYPPSNSPNGLPNLRIQFLNIPGHTPCSLAWYDIDENHLYVGDTFYERRRSIPIPELPDAGPVPGLPATNAAILFNELGANWIAYMKSLELLQDATQFWNAQLQRQHDRAGGRAGEAKRVGVACGHLTADADAAIMIAEVLRLFWKIIDGALAPVQSAVKGGVVYDFWLEGDAARYSVMAPRHLALEAREYFRKSGRVSGL
ncbi:hypothetical protein BP5796_03235 [Coleophoma crateriformis]|uniref:Metallo-beta-lactamase domain-containing protein n=1 Tax=Coleophoma crateriformis TaxID=565419 RepID=A0A3D8SMY7_9HELO|nr:hypothetical protein BP5796_03235 [Coleophoma crateriformis]